MAVNKPRWTGPPGWNHNTLFFVSEGGGLTMGRDRVMFKQVWEGPYLLCRSSAFTVPAGYFGGPFDGWNMQSWVVATSELTSLKGAKGRLTINWEPTADSGCPLPPEDFSIESVELYPKTERH